MGGLCLTALLIGKIASERQSALLLLIYTGDQQRRVSGFSNDLGQLAESLKSDKASKESVEKCLTLTEGLQAYLIFQSHQGRLADFGNGSALRELYRMMHAFLSSLLDVLNTSVLDPKLEVGLLKSARRIGRLASIMESFHMSDGSARARRISCAGLNSAHISVRKANVVRKFLLGQARCEPKLSDPLSEL